MILLFWFPIFKLLSNFKPNDLFIFSFSSHLNFFTKLSTLIVFNSCAIWYQIPFSIQSIKYSLIFNTGFHFFCPIYCLL
jgi:hypothetical protein